ncbi:MAG: NlpC/P60 family protein [Vibrio splendidus]
MKTGYMLIDEHELIGIEFRFGGREPNDALDCYGLMMCMYRWRGIELPDYLSPSDGPTVSQLVTSGLKLWSKTNEEIDGNMCVFQVADYLHVGYCLGDGWFVHTWEGSGGVTIEELDDWRGRLVGVYSYVGK